MLGVGVGNEGPVDINERSVWTKIIVFRKRATKRKSVTSKDDQEPLKNQKNDSTKIDFVSVSSSLNKFSSSA
jgi:hypothetical protein